MPRPELWDSDNWVAVESAVLVGQDTHMRTLTNLPLLVSYVPSSCCGSRRTWEPSPKNYDP